MLGRVEESVRDGAVRLRALIDDEPGRRDPTRFRAALREIAPSQRDVCVDEALSLETPPEDGPELPRGGVPYLPCSIDALLRVAEQVPVRASDVFVDVGAGVGRAAVLMHLLTGARVIGLEVQSALVAAARKLLTRFALPAVSVVAGDAVEQTAALSQGSVFFLYCPFSGERLVKLLEILQSVAERRTIHICCVDLRLPPCRFLQLVPVQSSVPSVDLTIYRSAYLSLRS